MRNGYKLNSEEMNQKRALEILYKEFYDETIEYNTKLKIDREERQFWLVDIYKAIIPGNKEPISVSLSGHQITIEHMLGMRVCFGCGVIYLGSHYIRVDGEQRVIALLQFIIKNMYSLRTAVNAIMSRSGLDEKKDNVITEIVRQSAKPMITELMFNTGLDYKIKNRNDYMSLCIAVGPKCHMEFKFSYDYFDEDYEYAKGWIKGIKPGPMK